MSLTLTLKDNGGNPVSGEGTSITLNNTTETNFTKFDLYGDTEQTTYSGKNLLNEDTMESGSFNYLNGGLFANNTFIRSQPIPCTPNTTYTFSSNSVLGEFAVVYYSSDGTTVVPGEGYMANYKSTSYTSPANAYYMRVKTGGSANPRTVDTNYDLQIEAGSTATPYEPYVGGTASPNPDYPQEVKTVTGEQTITVSNGQGESQVYPINLGKNLFDKDNANVINAWADASYIISGDVLRTLYISCEPNTTYTVQKENTGTNNRFMVFTTGVLPVVGAQVLNYVGTSGAADNNSSYTITTPANAKYLCVFFANINTTTPSVNEILATIQIEKGSTATTYAPYFTPIELCKIGTYQDYIYKSGEDWYVRKETQKNIFNGSENWASASAATGYTRCSVNSGGTVTVPDGYCDEFISRGSSSHGEYEYMWAQQTTNTVYIQVNNSRLGTASLANFKTWLGSHPASVYRTLATAADYQITYEPLVAQLDALYNTTHSYNGTTIVTSSSQYLPAIMDVTAGASTNEVTYTETELSNPLTITDIEGKSQNTTLNGNIYVDYVYNKKSFSVSIFNLKSADYATIRGFYDRQFTLNEFPLLSIPELNISEMPVFFEIGSREINSQCIVTDKLTLKFRETTQQ